MDETLTAAPETSMSVNLPSPLTGETGIYLDIIEEIIQKKYLSRLSEMEILPCENLLDLNKDLIRNVRVYRISEMVYSKGESATEKFSTVFNTLSNYDVSLFVLIDSDGRKNNFYLGVRNNEPDNSARNSAVTFGDTLQQTLSGHFPGVRTEIIDRTQIRVLSEKIRKTQNVTSVSVVADRKAASEKGSESFVQGIENLMLAMSGRAYTALIIADRQPPEAIQQMRRGYQELYTRLSPLQKVQYSSGTTYSESGAKPFSNMSPKEKAAAIGKAFLSAAGVSIGALAAGSGAAVAGTMLGGQVAGQFGGLIDLAVPAKQTNTGESQTQSFTAENRRITDMLRVLDELLKKTDEYDSYGLWTVAGYFLSDDMASAEIAAGNYRALMNGDSTGREVSSINSWNGELTDVTAYLSRFRHPLFGYGEKQDNTFILTNPATEVSGKELGLHLGLPRSTVPGLSVIEHAEFGKEVTSYSLFQSKEDNSPENRITIGRIFDLGHVSNRVVELNSSSLNMHTFITGSTGSGKSNAVYQILAELHQDKIPFLVIEPAKGEYKNRFGNWDDVRVFSTNPKIAPLIHLNPFHFPDSIHVLEHVDGLVEIFSACWPMYDAMPAFFKDAILKSYEVVGWDLGSSTFTGNKPEYPDFEVLAEQLDKLIGSSEYAAEVKSNYRGALLTRVRSLTVGLNRYIFSGDQTPFDQLFDENCILDLSRVKSSETTALLMGLTVYALNEYREERKTGSDQELRHVTVLEEAHNLLKNTGAGVSELVGKSVEMLTNTIAEIRTYGEGFIIVDQSPSSVDIAAIKNTNTKIILRTPEAHDREAVGRSVGLTDAQVEEIAKLPGGVAVVYQNDWTSPVMAFLNKANVEESPFRYDQTSSIEFEKQARTELIRMRLRPNIKRAFLSRDKLEKDLRSLVMKREHRLQIQRYIDEYVFFDGKMVWQDADEPLLRAILGIDTEPATPTDADKLKNIVEERTKGLDTDEIKKVCELLRKDGTDNV